MKNFKNFSFIDAGCGTGWVVRMVSKMNLCVNACGIDGSRKMIEKAKSLDGINNYYCDELSLSKHDDINGSWSQFLLFLLMIGIVWCMSYIKNNVSHNNENNCCMRVLLDDYGTA